MVDQTLIVYVPGLVERPALARQLLQRVRAELKIEPESIWIYPYTVGPFTRGAMESHAERLCENIEGYWQSRERPLRVIVIGHSIGAVLVRYAYLLALGELGGRRRDWANHVWRIVLLSGPNRGFDFERLRPVRRRIVTFVAWLVRGFSALDVRAGSAFMTNLRLTWMRRVAELGDEAPLVVQVRGDKDELVRREDSRDIECLPTGVDLFVPFARHGEMPRVEGVRESFPGQRFAKLREAILDDRLRPQDPPELPERERDYQSIVFVLHGIRAGNDTWVAELEKWLTKDPSVGVVTASYGRFSAYNFAFPLTRRRTLRWFQDQYSYYLARHPNLPFHCVGHSNGTYLLGQSLRQVRAIRFVRVYLAGSVLPRDFAWRDYAANGRIGALVNVCASEDKPVAWLCSMLNGLGMRDVGLGGFVGFDVVPADASQLRHIPGGHSEALSTERLPAIADYIRSGEFADNTSLVRPSESFAVISRAAPYMAWGIVLAIAATVAYSVVAGILLPAIILVAALSFLCFTLKIL